MVVITETETWKHTYSNGNIVRHFAFKKESYALSFPKEVALATLLFLHIILSPSFFPTVNDQAKALSNYQTNFVLLSHTFRIPIFLSHFWEQTKVTSLPSTLERERDIYIQVLASAMNTVFSHPYKTGLLMKIKYLGFWNETNHNKLFNFYFASNKQVPIELVRSNW